MQLIEASRRCTEILGPNEVFPAWRRAQWAAGRCARETQLPSSVLRKTGFLPPDLAEWVTEWFTTTNGPPTEAVQQSYRALARETEWLYAVVERHLGVRVRYERTDGDPYDSAAELCTALRDHGSMSLRTGACDGAHPLLGGAVGGILDRLRVVHDVLGHAALGVGFDLQSEFATWLQCRTLFSTAARPAAFCELVGAVTAYVTTGEKPKLQAKVPPSELLLECERSRQRMLARW